MFRRLAVFLCLLSISLSLAPSAPATAQEGEPARASLPPVLCAPGVYLAGSYNCQPIGPSAYLTRMAGLGLVFPIKPVQASRPDPQLVSLPFHYVRLQDKSAEIFSTAEDAVAGKSPVGTIPAGQGLKFISYVDFVDVNGGKPDAYMLRSGGWVASRDVGGRWGAVPGFQGLLFQETPRQRFGWVNGINSSIETKRTPGFKQDDYTGRFLSQYSVVIVYAVEMVADMEWAMIGPDEWVQKRFVGSVIPNTTPPEGVTNGRWIEVNLYEQTLAVYDQSRLVFATLIASGLEPFYTRPGVFQVYKRHESTPMSGTFEANRADFYYLEDVPWTLYYDKARALHGAYWRTNMGYAQSHGCVNLTPGDAHWLFDWAKEGDWVYVWDPSGRTPTDPAYYNDGGA